MFFVSEEIGGFVYETICWFFEELWDVFIVYPFCRNYFVLFAFYMVV